MIKYTILYKNGKTWNGKCNHIDDLQIFANDIIHITIIRSRSVYVLWPKRTWEGKVSVVQTVLHGHTAKFKLPRTPNPASVTKKQKAFDEAYADWKINNSNLVEYDDGSGYMKYAHVGNGDTSIKAYKKYLWEKKQAELKSVLKETSLDEFVKIWDGIYAPWEEIAIGKFHRLAGEVDEGALPITLELSYDTPIKTTYTFWLGAFGEIENEL